MKFDSIIIGGGLSGLTAGIKLAKAGKKVALVAAGHSTLHFNSGSFDLLGCDEQGNAVANPTEAIAKLSAKHPYNKVADVAKLAGEAKQLLADAGLAVEGDAARNHYRLSPMGVAMPAWLTIGGYLTLSDPASVEYKNVAIVNINGYLDFPVAFVADALEKMGAKVAIKTINTPALEAARRSPSEMRATNIAKVLERDGQLEEAAQAINAVISGEDAVLLPAVLGIADGNGVALLSNLVKTTVRFVATLPPSVPGVRTETLLRKRFEALGGTYIAGDRVKGGKFKGQRLASIETENLTGAELAADTFVLATGSFMSRGLSANYQRVWETVFNLDVDTEADRVAWTREDVFDAQPYQEFGVKTDAKLRVSLGGKTVDNFYAAGSVLSGHNSLKLADGTGVSMLTALQVANNILND